MTFALAWFSLAIALAGPCEALLRLAQEASNDFPMRGSRDVVLFDRSELPSPPNGQPPVLVGGLTEDEGRFVALVLIPDGPNAQRAWEDAVDTCLSSGSEHGKWHRAEERGVPVGKEGGYFPEAAYIREDHPPRGVYWTASERNVRIELVEDATILRDFADRLLLETPPGAALRIARAGSP